MALPDLLKVIVLNGEKQENFLLSVKKEFNQNHTFDDVKMAIFKRKPELLNVEEINFYWIGESQTKKLRSKQNFHVFVYFHAL
jgi:hypothetical protein